MSPTEIIGALLSALGVWLSGRRKVISWPVSLLASSLYFVVFLRARLYADAALQAVFCGCLVYGWWCWFKRREVRGEVDIASPRLRAIAFHLAVAAVASLCLGGILARWSDDPAPWLDAGLSCYSIVGQVWTARRLAINWLLWIVVDTIYAALFLNRALPVTALLYAGFVILAAWGWWQWKRMRPV